MLLDLEGEKTLLCMLLCMLGMSLYCMERPDTQECQKMREKALTAQLFQAVRRKQPDRVQQLIDQGADVNGINAAHCTPLIRAASHTTPEILKVLLLNGAQIDLEEVYRIQIIKDSVEWSELSTYGRANAYSFFTVKRKAPLLSASCASEEELYKRGAYLIDYFSFSNRSNDRRSILIAHKQIAERIVVVHRWLNAELGIRDLEELVRSFEISTEATGRAFYWDVVADLEDGCMFN